MNNEKLRFTAQDRQAVFQQLEEGKQAKKTRLWMPIFISAAAFCISMILWLPQRSGEEAMDIIQPPETGMSSDAGGPALASYLEETTLVTIVDDEKKAHVNIVMHYNEQYQTLYLYPLARNMYISIDHHAYRLYEAYQANRHQTVVEVGTLFDQAITLTKELTMDELQALLNRIPLTYTVEQDILLKGITQSPYTLSKGVHELTGEQLIGLILATTDYDNLDESFLAEVIKPLLAEWGLSSSDVVIQPMSEYATSIMIDEQHYYQYDEQQIQALWK